MIYFDLFFSKKTLQTTHQAQMTRILSNTSPTRLSRSSTLIRTPFSLTWLILIWTGRPESTGNLPAHLVFQVSLVFLHKYSFYSRNSNAIHQPSLPRSKCCGIHSWRLEKSPRSNCRTKILWERHSLKILKFMKVHDSLLIKNEN